MKKTVFFTVILLFSNVLIGCEKQKEEVPIPDPDSINWQLVFEDDFDGTSVNTDEWSMYDSPGHAGNGLRRPEAFSVADGILTVTAQMKDGVLVSGGMASKRNYTYGKFEFRVRTEPDPSEATSGVVLTWPQSENFPTDGEYDIYETLTTPASRSPFNTFLHYGADNSQYHFVHNANGTEWHTMAMVWTEDAIRIYRDDSIVYKLTDPAAIVHVPHHLCIQLDAFQPTMTGTVRMYVDWVKFYQEQ
jgi:beta-glucanase (GH16 family)